MGGNHQTHRALSAFVRSSALLVTPIVVAAIGAAQDFPAAVPSALTGRPPMPLTGFSRLPPLSSTGVMAGRAGQVNDAVTDAVGQLVRSGRRRVTLQQVQQQSANRLASSLANMSHLS